MTQTNLIIRIKRKLSVPAAKPLYIGVAGNQEKEKKDKVMCSLNVIDRANVSNLLPHQNLSQRPHEGLLRIFGRRVAGLYLIGC